MWFEILLVLAIFLIYFILIFIFKRFGIFEKYHISLFGPIIMWRTKRGREFLDRLSKPRTFWRYFGNLSIFLCTLGMLFMFLTLVLGALVAVSVQTDPVPIQNILVLPGLNPMIPIWYGIFGLAIAIIIHEFTHGILSRRIKLKLKTKRKLDNRAVLLLLLFTIIHLPIHMFVDLLV